MTKSAVQYAFHTGEWAPALNARVDQQKYHTGVALAENFFVDYRGGLSSRTGTKYILKTFREEDVRLIPFQATFSTGYVLEFGLGYIRFYLNGAPILESALNITAATQANPCVVSVVNTYNVGDIVFISGVVGMTQLNGKYFRVNAATGATITLGDVYGTNINSLAYGAYVSGGTVRRVYQITSPYLAVDLPLLKFKVNVDRMIINHPNYRPYELRLITSTNWTLTPIVFGSSIAPTTGVGANTTLSTGPVHYAYVVTSVDVNGQESVPSARATLADRQDLRTNAGSNSVFWNVVANAVAYNVYKAELCYLTGGVPAGAFFGYIGTTTGDVFVDSNIEPDFTITPPTSRNPFVGSGVVSYTVTVNGAYTVVPAVTVAPPTGGSVSSATASAILGATAVAVAAGGAGYIIGELITLGNGVIVVVTTVAAGAVTGATLVGGNPGAITSGATPANPRPQVSTSGGGAGATFNLTWGVTEVIPISQGGGYTAAPAVSFSPVGASATAVLGASTGANPRVPSFYNQRLVQGALVGAPQSLYLSQPGLFYNFDVSSPVQPDDSITASLIAGQLGEIKSFVPMQSGLIALSDTIAWLINAGGSNEAVTPINITGNPNSYIGANDVPPIVVGGDIIYNQSKGNTVRNLNYSFYNNQFTGKDISILSSHLFDGKYVKEWAWAEEPFKIVWAVRNDGVMLTLTFLPEQELIGWTHQVTDGTWKSVCTVTEVLASGQAVDAVYAVVERTIGNGTWKYVERVAERQLNGSRANAWCVDAALQYSGAPATSFSNGQHLQGKTVTGLADGEIIPPFVMPTSGDFVLAAPASLVVVGLPFSARMQTLEIDVGSPSVQGKMKKIAQVNLKVKDTLNIKIGMTEASLVNMSDFRVGQINRQDNRLVTDLYTGNGLINIDPMWTVPGQYFIRQNDPYPVSVLGVFPDIVEEDIDNARSD